MKPMSAQERKEHPIYSGFIKYFPKAMMAVAHLSKVGNDQHNPGKPLHWDRSKSGDELDALSRHLKDAGTRDTDGEWHDTKVAWRAMANLEKLLEREEVVEQIVELHEAQTREEADRAAENEFFYDPRSGKVAGEEPLPVGTSLPPTIPANPSDALRSAMEDLGFKVSDEEGLSEQANAGKIGWTGELKVVNRVIDKTDEYERRIDAARQAEVSPPPFIPMTFINKPNTETFGPEYEDDEFPTDDADAGGVREVEAIENEDHEPYRAPDPGMDPIRMRKTSGDIPSWAIRS